MTVTAPPDVQVRLLDLQAFDGELARLAGERRRIEAGAELATAREAQSGARRTAADRRGTRDDLRTRMQRTESDVAVVEQRLARDRQRLAATASPRDAQGLEQEITALLRRRATLEDAELELMQELEDAELAAAEADTALVGAEARVATLQGERDDRLGHIRDGEKRLTADRAGLAEQLPADLVSLYDRQRTRYGIGAALIRRRVSGGSNVELTGADLAAVRAAAADAVILDPDSGCILIRTDESGL